jgi:hypothetical protein
MVNASTVIRIDTKWRMVEIGNKATLKEEWLHKTMSLRQITSQLKCRRWSYLQLSLKLIKSTTMSNDGLILVL